MNDTSQLDAVGGGEGGDLSVHSAEEQSNEQCTAGAAPAPAPVCVLELLTWRPVPPLPVAGVSPEPV